MNTRVAMLALACLGAAPGLAFGQSLSERAAIVTQQRAAATAASKATVLRTLLATGLSVDFQETKARDAFEWLRKTLKVDMVVRWSDDRNPGDGIDPEAPITLKLDRAQALAVLERMIDAATQEPATWQLRKGGYLEVGPKSRLNSPGALETQIHPIGDLLFEAPNFDNAPEFNLNQAVQSGGTAGGGGGGGGATRATVGPPGAALAAGPGRSGVASFFAWSSRGDPSGGAGRRSGSGVSLRPATEMRPSRTERTSESAFRSSLKRA